MQPPTAPAPFVPSPETAMQDPMLMDFDDDPTPIRRRYALCRAAFLFGTVGLALLGLSAMLELAIFVTRDPELLRVAQSRWWHWGVGAPITWTTVLSAYLLWGRWPDASWQRRAGILLLLNTFDLVVWIIQNDKDLGLRIGDIGHAWLRNYLTESFGWIEFMLFGSLAAEVATRPQSESAGLLGSGVRGLSTLGLILCTLSFALGTDWARGWPLGHVPWNHGMLLAAQTTCLLLTVATVQLVALMGMAARQCARDLRTIKAADPMPDLLVSRSETEWDDRGESPRK